MNRLSRIAIATVALCYGALAFTQDDGDPRLCLECHDYGEDSPVHEVLANAHGIGVEPGDSSGRRACLDCHGNSAEHMRAPRRNAPDVSFGPRWGASANEQDLTCLGCHEENTAENWQHALHMVNGVTCVTCHDIHQPEDKVQFVATQAEVCSQCHQVQTQGIHGMTRRKNRNPPCTACHNPHDHESARHEMRANHSAGCLTCHDLARIAESDRISDKAKSYHKVMTNPERTCIDCHDGVAHPEN